VADGVLTLFPSVRFDHYKLAPKTDPLFTTFSPRAQSGSRVTPRLGAVAKLGGGVRVFANHAAGFKPPEPNQINNGFANLVSNYRSIPNPDLKPETSQSIEAGIRLNGTGWSLSGTAFSSRFRDFIDQVQIGGAFTASDPAVYQYINRGRVKIEGLEGRGEARLPIGLGVRAAAAYTTGTMRTAGVPGTLPLDSVDPFKLVAGAFYEPAGGPFRADLTATHSSGKNAGDVTASCSFGFSAGLPCYPPNGFWAFDATVSLRVLDRVTLRGGVFNITDRKYFLVERRARRRRRIQRHRRLFAARPQSRPVPLADILRPDMILLFNLCAAAALLVATPLLPGAVIAQTHAVYGDKARDRAAILAMAGTFKVTFDMRETTPLVAGYTLYPAKLSGGHEVVRAIVDTPDRIVLQHLLVTSDGNGKTMVIKHWRQDWTWQPTTVLTYTAPGRWTLRTVPEAERTGAWSQTVWQTDDSPRYGGIGRWRYDDNAVRWTSDETRRPLARRDATRNPPYDHYLGTNRHVLTPAG